MPRRVALELAKLEGANGSIKGKLKRTGWTDAFQARVFAAFGASQMR